MFQKKSLGQNFLKSESALQKIVDAGDIVSGVDTIVEIGPGEGVLTQKILEKSPKALIVIEKDDRLIPKLQEKFKKSSNLDIIHADILDIEDFSTLKDLGSHGFDAPYKVIANIPYYITGLIIRLVFSQKVLPEKVILMMQKEVVDRVVGTGKDNQNKEGIHKENLMSASIKFYGTPKKIANVPRGAFVPAPNVDSAILEIGDIKKPDPKLEEVYFQIIKQAFSHKRKRLVRNLEGLLGKDTTEWVELIKKSTIESAQRFKSDEDYMNLRAEEIDYKVYVNIAKNILS
jgi:16S rRNA (adenine1518-N6/adenine1519-N6)-dimethyltransferase